MMRRMMNRGKLIRLTILTSALILLGLVVSGCWVGGSPSSKKGTTSGEKRASSEYQKIKNSIQLDTIAVTPNTAGFMTFYGEVTNGSGSYVRKVHITVVSVVKDKGEIKPSGIIGKTVVEDLNPGDKKAFDITTSVESSDFTGYEVMVEKIEL